MAVFFLILHHADLFYMSKLRRFLFGTFKVIWHLFTGHRIRYLAVFLIIHYLAILL